MSCCGRYLNPLNRREMLQRCANGFGALALSALWADHEVQCRNDASRRHSEIRHLSVHGWRAVADGYV